MKKKITKNVPRARLYVLATFNNTIITLTDEKGDVLASSSSGKLGFKGARKSTLYAAQQATQNVLEKAKNCSVRELDIFVSGVGSGRDAAVKCLPNSGFMVKSIKDVTPVPHNGCRPKKPRRV